MNQCEFNDDEIESPIEKTVSVAYVIILSQRKTCPEFPRRKSTKMCSH